MPCTLFSLLMLILFASISYYARSCGFEVLLYYSLSGLENESVYFFRQQPYLFSSIKLSKPSKKVVYIYIIYLIIR